MIIDKSTKLFLIFDVSKLSGKGCNIIVLSKHSDNEYTNEVILSRDIELLHITKTNDRLSQLIFDPSSLDEKCDDFTTLTNLDGIYYKNHIILFNTSIIEEIKENDINKKVYI